MECDGHKKPEVIAIAGLILIFVLGILWPSLAQEKEVKYFGSHWSQAD